MAQIHSIIIKNYKSIEELEIPIKKANDQSYSVGLVGINEAGKSSILKAIALKDNPSLGPTIKDFRVRDIPIEIHFNAKSDKNDLRKINDLLLSDNISIKAISFWDFTYVITINSNDIGNRGITINNSVIESVKTVSITIFEKLVNYLVDSIPKVVFWASSSNYLINEPILLSEFAANTDISVPLKNCFFLAGIKDINSAVNLALSDFADGENIEDNLSTAVTKHISSIWKYHPIKITFRITDGRIAFLVKDLSPDAKSNTVDQRSDGFKQFISFLLTISADHFNGSLTNTIFLIDEPETHLHPKAQLDLMAEITQITVSENNNVIIFATHSNYLISKDSLDKYLHVKKINGKTQLEKFNHSETTYAEVNFEVFDIISSDYHNILYGNFQQLYDCENTKEIDQKLKELLKEKYQEREYIKEIGGKQSKMKISIHSYIRHIIHHPENELNNKFNEKELHESITILRELLLQYKQTQIALNMN